MIVNREPKYKGYLNIDELNVKTKKGKVKTSTKAKGKCEAKAIIKVIKEVVKKAQPKH